MAISNDDFLHEVDEWAGNPAAVDPTELEALPPGTLPQTLVAQILQQRIDLELHAQEFDELGLELTDEMRTATLTTLFGDEATAQQALSGFTRSFADSYIDDVVKQSAVEAELGLEYGTWQAEAYADTDIVVNSRYGTWDSASATITPPDGPLDPASTADLELGQ